MVFSKNNNDCLLGGIYNHRRGKFLGMPMRDFYRLLPTPNILVPLHRQASRTPYKGEGQLRISMNLSVLLLEAIM